MNGHLPRARARLLEGHPEVSFREMARLRGVRAPRGASAADGAGADDRPLAHGKASAAGLMLRADLLAAQPSPRGPPRLTRTGGPPYHGY